MAKSAKKTEESKKTTRYIGWQKSPLHQAFHGKTTQGGARTAQMSFKNSTGPVNSVEKRWYILDAATTPVGRLATTAASILLGKHLPSFTPGAGSGDYVIVINAEKAFFTSNKADKKIYYRHTGWIGGLKMETARLALQKHPEKVIYDAVYGMLPKNRLSRKQLRHLKIYHGADHKQDAQKGTIIELKTSGLLKNIGAASGGN